jgi:hypothetical protein
MPESLSRGKWSASNVPHKGWKCIADQDLGEPAETCEMCESSEIRYVHVMQHPDYPEVLRCGRICAGHMENDYVAAENRERTLQNRAARRANWLQRKWRVSAKGNWFLNTDGFNIVVYPKAGKWRAAITHRETERVVPSNRSYSTAEACKLATFDALLFIKKHLVELMRSTPIRK